MMEKFVYDRMPEEEVSAIREFIQTKLAELERGGVHCNEVIREDILPLLDRYCDVLYFPKEDGGNNGFHKTYIVDGEKVDVVYINTAQSKEKQIFTAAHELGHIWRLDQWLEKQLSVAVDYDHGERIMNRFAAELLMPERLFRDFAEKAMDGARNEDGKMTVGNMVQAVTAMMNEFYVPYKSVVYRLYELALMPDKWVDPLWTGESAGKKKILEEHSQKVAREQGYTRLYQRPDERKGIEGLRELLDQAAERRTQPEGWLKEFYRRFEFKVGEQDGSLNDSLSVPQEREETEDGAAGCD